MSSGAQVDFLIVGAGVAGLRAAVELARHGDVLVVTKESLDESNTHYAQGGIAVAMRGDEDIALHLDDTLNAGDGLVHRPAAQALVSEGPQRVAELIEWGAKFDCKIGPDGVPLSGEYLRTREGAHSLARILHANGDATGAEISRSLAAFARAHERIRFAEWTRVSRLTVAAGSVIAADLASAELSTSARPGHEAGRQIGRQANLRTPMRVSARAILIAAGGAGQVYSDTTNPAVATGDGIALAAEAGAELADMEFYQFHPTALSLPGAPRFLLSEALRGEGAWLRNDRGERFMERYHPSLELAPRDVVARAVAREGMSPEGTSKEKQQPRPVYLDMRHVTGIDLHRRFPGISSFLARYSLDLHRDLIPVRPAAHYLMGGIRTDLDGRTSVRGLFAAGEAACTGVHGANRLASNSLLEGLVFGARAARTMLSEKYELSTADAPGVNTISADPAGELLIETRISNLQSAMWKYAGLLRDASSLRHGLEAQKQCAAAIEGSVGEGKTSRRLFEARSLCRISSAILQSALARTESRGAHFRSDHPQRDDAHFQKHSIYGRKPWVAFETW